MPLPKLSSGDIIAILTGLGSVAAAWYALADRITVLETRLPDVIHRLERIENKIDNLGNYNDSERENNSPRRSH